MLENVKEYYGKILQSSADLKTDACCTPTGVPDWLRPVLADIHPEVQSRYYGCGLVMPQAVEGTRILDLGCGAGRDCYALSRLAGQEGMVVGVDMTAEQLAVAKAHVEWHRERFGHCRTNVDFRFGYIEKLDEIGLKPASFDIVISNCVVNLSSDKHAVLKGAWDLLKPGGEFYFSDTYADRRVPDDIRNDPVLHGECLGGALYWNDFLKLARQAGFADPRLVEARRLGTKDHVLKQRLGRVGFVSATWRLFKLEGLEESREDYGQAVCYKGGIPHAEETFALDAEWVFEPGRVVAVCSNTWRMLKESRFSRFFDFFGDGKTHFGPFPFGTPLPLPPTGKVGEESLAEPGSSCGC